MEPIRTASQWMKEPTIFGSAAVALLIDSFGSECLEWDPTSLSLEMRGAFGQEPEDELFDRILSAISLLKSNAFFVDLTAFMNTCNALNFGVVTSETWIPADLDDVLWGVTEARMLLGDDFDEDDFSHDIKRYVGMLVQEEGLKNVPSVLRFLEVDERIEEVYEEAGGDLILEQTFDQDNQEEEENLEPVNQQRLEAYMQQMNSLPIKQETRPDEQEETEPFN